MLKSKKIVSIIVVVSIMLLLVKTAVINTYVYADQLKESNCAVGTINQSNKNKLSDEEKMKRAKRKKLACGIIFGTFAVSVSVIGIVVVCKLLASRYFKSTPPPLRSPILATNPMPILTTNPTPILATNPTPILATNPTPILATNPMPILTTNPSEKPSYKLVKEPSNKRDTLIMSFNPVPEEVPFFCVDDMSGMVCIHGKPIFVCTEGKGSGYVVLANTNNKKNPNHVFFSYENVPNDKDKNRNVMKNYQSSWINYLCDSKGEVVKASFNNIDIKTQKEGCTLHRITITDFIEKAAAWDFENNTISAYNEIEINLI